MFYSHQLLARKAPLGQIWMAATMHAKINRRKLDKINLVKICEEILNPTVPMALRLSGILLGGVVIVYERKVKLLYDDLTRLVVEINEAWKMKPEADPTILPKSKLRAKYEAVTLEEKPLDDEMMAELEQQESLRYAAASAATFQQSTFLHMGLDSVGDAYININPGEEDIDLQHHHHQADIENITLFEDINPRLQETSLFNRAERFDNIIEGSGHITFSQSYPEVPMTLMPSPPEAPEDVVNMKQEEKPSSNDCKSKSEKTKQDGQKRQHTRRKTRGKSDAVVMDIEQTIIPGQMYQTWIRDASDIVSRRGRKRKSLHPFFSAKISDLMELPPVALISGFQNDITGEIHYPAALLDLWKKFTHQPRKQDSRPGTIPGSQKQQPYSATERQKPWEPRDFLFEDFQNVPDIEKLMQLSSDKKQQDNPMEFDFMTVGSSGHSAAESIRSASSGRGSIQIEKEFQLSSDRSKKRQSPSSRQSFGSLDPVLEENSMREYRTDFKLRRVSEGPTPEFELMEETGPTQTMKPQNTELALNEITRTIQTQLKTHFDAPGAPRAESLNQLALGMNRRKAAQLFYHTCVLATTDFLRVEQSKPYGEIYISRGSKM